MRGRVRKRRRRPYPQGDGRRRDPPVPYGNRGLDNPYPKRPDT
ncbi:hypothetical protein ARZXY2_3703 [Arthrobacter sp. ZXY-2]|nr:hypothetical protein ARZXY2_3703 [Arthrobacter sp. ZXY-2]